ncbi:MAG TPA: 4-(cytidine 5'-diphospho)-2-C-methyl-D-erythritol kinase [Candidatus Accumulibacter phosphatis]|nr:4-(cytidine 5'-diphospho)-2-C-methyl-D-erythritol kinase [Candidatus Accumulibacter phosphatis]
MSLPASTWDWDSSYPAPAKLNLCLRIVGRRSDGYHLLQTVFRFLEHADRLHFSPRDDAAIRLTTPLPGVPPENDLSVRAARLLQTESGCRQGVDIHVEKRLPLGGGLGGGSSDAATVLLALNHLWQLGLPRQRLQQIGLALGADVPVFVFGSNAFAEGVGESLRAIELPARWYVVVEPPVQVPTALIFAAPELRRDAPAITADDWHPGAIGNELEAVACSRFPAIADCLRQLSAAAAPARARMTGSGACVFAECSSHEQAAATLRRLPSGMRAWASAGAAAHPLRDLAR